MQITRQHRQELCVRNCKLTHIAGYWLGCTILYRTGLLCFVLGSKKDRTYKWCIHHHRKWLFLYGADIDQDRPTYSTELYICELYNWKIVLPAAGAICMLNRVSYRSRWHKSDVMPLQRVPGISQEFLWFFLARVGNFIFYLVPLWGIFLKSTI